MFHITRRRRNILLACTAVAVGGYASYRIYNSRKRLRVFLLLQSFSSLLDALSQGSDSAAVVVSDLRAFLCSDGDELPQSLKQLLKLGGSHEVQQSVTVLSAAICRGVLTTLLNGGSVALSLKHHESMNAPGSSRRLSGVETKDVIRWGGGEAIASIDDRALSPDEEMLAEDNWRDCHEVWDESVMRTTSSTSACVDLGESVKSQVDSSLLKGAKEALQGRSFGESLGYSGRSEEGRGTISFGSGNKDKYVNKLIEKLFSESGKGFVSAVVGSASRSFVVSFLEHVNMPNSDSSSVGGKGDMTGAVLKGVAEFASGGEGRALLIDCIQTFVGTAVSVYVEKTKDINAFDELVAGLVKSEYREPITDLLTTVCQATASSFVRASHEVLTADPSGSPRSTTSSLNPHIPSLNPGGGSSSGYDNAVTSYDDVGKQGDVGSYGWRGNSGGFKKEEIVQMDLIQGLSKALAVPSNRKLILEIAGTMTTQGVRSAIDVSLGKLSTALRGGKGKEHAAKALEHETSKQTVVGEKLQLVGDMTKSAIDKSMVLMTMCIAVCFRSVIGGVRMIQPF